MNLTTLGNVVENVNRVSKNHWDENIAVDDMKFESLDRLSMFGESHHVRPAAQRSISNRLGIPFNYLKKCPEDLQAENLNRWLSQERNEKLFMRFDGHDVRAIFTPRYVPMDHTEVLQRLLEHGFDESTQVQGQFDEEMLLLSIPDKEKAFLLPGRDEMRPGISITNSEVGISSLTLSVFVLRLICTNGLISKTSEDSSYRHISNRVLDEFPKLIDRASQDITRQQHQWKLSQESTVDHPDSTLKSFNNQFQLSQNETEAVEWGYTHEPGNRMFHIINAYTKGAQYQDLTTESSYKLQKTGGSILSMLN